MIVPFLIFYLLIEVIQTWFIIFEKRLRRGVKAIILIEILELPLEIYLILQGRTLIILVLISIMVIQGLSVVILFNLRE